MRKPIFLTIFLLVVFSLVKAQTTDTLKGLRADTLIFTLVEHEPEFPGGIEKFYAYLAKNLQYKNFAPTKNITTKIFISFIVEKNGNLSNVKVSSNGFGPKLSEEDASSPFYKDVIGMLKMCPKWKPAIQNGYVVRCRYNVPINIDLTTGEK